MTTRLTDNEARAIGASIIAIGDVSANLLATFEGITWKRAKEIADIEFLGELTQEEVDQIRGHMPDKKDPPTATAVG